ncbi:MAG: hypothetical protein ACREBN_09290 [Burkholderiaceae bacterium]
MPCHHIGNAIVCTRGSKAKSCGDCHQAASYQCDWKVGARATCDAWLCGGHAKKVGPNKHLCPRHQVAYDAWLAARALRAQQP